MSRCEDRQFPIGKIKTHWLFVGFLPHVKCHNRSQYQMVHEYTWWYRYFLHELDKLIPLPCAPDLNAMVGGVRPGEFGPESQLNGMVCCKCHGICDHRAMVCHGQVSLAQNYWPLNIGLFSTSNHLPYACCQWYGALCFCHTCAFEIQTESMARCSWNIRCRSLGFGRNPISTQQNAASGAFVGKKEGDVSSSDGQCYCWWRENMDKKCYGYS